MGGAGRTLLTVSLSGNFFTFSRFSMPRRLPLLETPNPTTLFQGFRPLCTATTTTTTPNSTVEADLVVQPLKHSMLLERLRLRHLKDSAAKIQQTRNTTRPSVASGEDGLKKSEKNKKEAIESFEELGLSEEVMGSVREMGIEIPTEIQCIGIPAVLEGRSVVLGSHTGSGKTLAYLLPLVQLLRRDEEIFGMLMKANRPRAVVLCPTRELSEQVFRVAKSISHHARFRSTMVSGGGRLRPQEDSLNGPIDLIVGTPGRVLQHIEEGNIVYGDIKYLVLDEADTMFDRGFGPDIRKFLGPLRNRASRPDGKGFQTVLVTATMTKAVQKLVDEEFQGIEHLRTSTLHKKISSARHDFIKLSGSENKLEALLQVLEPSLAKGNRVMVFCNTLNSSRAVDHFLSENQISTVNYHGEVPAEQRVENLKKFKSDDGECPTLVCTDLAARGLDLDVDHVIMFDFPSTSIDYLHRTGRTARMGAKGKVTSLVAKRDVNLATRIEEAVSKNESLESLTVDNVRRDIARTKITEQKGKNEKMVRSSSEKSRTKTGTPRNTAPAKSSAKTSGIRVSKRVTATARPSKTAPSPSGRPSKSGPRTTSFPSGRPSKSGPRTTSSPSGRPLKSGTRPPSSPSGRPSKSGPRTTSSPSGRPSKSGPRPAASSSGGKTKQAAKGRSGPKSTASKLSVVGFRRKSSISDNKFSN